MSFSPASSAAIRSDKNSVQKNYNIKPGITTIGKIIGGGMPIGIIGISKKVYQMIKNKKIFYGGTFSGNSLSSFVGNETLKYLNKNQSFFPLKQKHLLNL